MRTQKGWTLFFVGILISTFLGGAVRVLLSPSFVRQWVEDIVTRSQPKFTFEFVEAKMSFGRGWIPQVAIELSHLKVRAKDPCITDSEISLNQIVVPLNLNSLMSGQIRFGNIAADQVTYFHRPRRCEVPVTDLPFDVASEIAPLENFFQRRWSKEVINTTRFLNELNVAELRVVSDELSEPLFYLRDLNLAFFSRKSEAELRFDFWPGVAIAGNQPFGPTVTVIRIGSEAVQWTALGNLKEGQIRSHGEWLVDKGQYNFHLHWQDMPLANFMALMHRWNFSVLQDFKISNEWVTCGFSSKGELRNVAVNTIHADVCEIYGDSGRVKLQAIAAKPQEWSDIEYNLDLQGVDVRRLSRAFGYESWSNYLTKVGTFTGRVKTKLRGQFAAAGVVRGIEIYWGDFGLPSARGDIGSAKLQVEVQAGGFDLSLTELRSESLPHDAKVNIKSKAGLTNFIFSAPKVDFSTRWPLVSEVAKQALGGETAFPLQDFNFSFEKSALLTWKIAATQVGEKWSGTGILLDGDELRGDIVVHRQPQKMVLRLTGTLREPVVVRDQAP